MRNSLSVSARDIGTLAQTDVKISIEEKDGVQTVSARELHEKLESNERFSKWWNRFVGYGFAENEDFVACTKRYKANQHGGEKEFGDYAITIEMAKHICMMQRSELGKKYREYFLRLEKAWNTPEAVMARALQVAERTLEEVKRRVAEQQSLIEEQRPKVAVYDELVDRSKVMNFRDMAAKIGMRQSEVMAILKARYIYRTSSGEYRAYAEYQKYFTTRTFTRGVDKTGEQLMLSMEGIQFFINRYKVESIAESWMKKEVVHG